MITRILRNAALPLLLLAALCLGSLTAAAAEPLSKADVEKIVRDYLFDHPQDMLDSLEAYQRKMLRANSAKGLALHKESLFNDSSVPEIGNPKGDVTIVEFMDYNCHFCKDALPIIQSVLEKDKNVRVLFRDFPILGPTSETAAKWALAAHRQKKYIEYHTLLMKNREPLTDARLEKLAQEVGLNVEQAKQYVAGEEVAAQIAKTRTLARDLSIGGTPAFVVGDDLQPGGASLEDLLKRVEEQRRAANKKKD